jgi:hypothetical protein
MENKSNIHQDVSQLPEIVQKFATVNPETLSASKPYTVQNRVHGAWKQTKAYTTIIDPLNGDSFLQVPETVLLFEKSQYPKQYSNRLNKKLEISLIV